MATCWMLVSGKNLYVLVMWLQTNCFGLKVVKASIFQKSVFFLGLHCVLVVTQLQKYFKQKLKCGTTQLENYFTTSLSLINPTRNPTAIRN